MFVAPCLKLESKQSKHSSRPLPEKPERIHAMGSPTWNTAWAKYMDDAISSKMVKVQVKIIATDPEAGTELTKSDAWKELEGKGLQWSFLSSPCRLTAMPKNHTTGIVELDIRHNFTPDMWAKVQTDRSGAAIAISHLRAIWEALHHVPRPELIIILEEDMESTDNIEAHMAHFLSEWWNNPNLEHNHFVVLCYDEKKGLGLHKLTKDQNRQKVMGTESFIGCFLQRWPMNQDPRHKPRFEWIGQGARAYAMSAQMAEYIVEAPVADWWDLHMMKLLAHKYNNLKTTTEKYNMACVYWPCMFQHPVRVDQRFRGSGRLEQSAVNTAEGQANYIVVDLSTHQYGLSNRIQTINVMLELAAMHRYGVYIVWPKNVACPQDFGDVFEFEYTTDTMKRIPFVSVIPDGTNHLKAHSRNNRWHKGTFHANVPMEAGMQTLHRMYTDQIKFMSEKVKNIYQPVVDQRLTSRDPFRDIFQNMILNGDVVCLGMEFHQQVQNNSGLNAKTVAFHVRRGDHYWFNNTKAVSGQSTITPEMKQIMDEWTNSDLEVQDHHRNPSARVIWRRECMQRCTLGLDLFVDF